MAGPLPFESVRRLIIGVMDGFRERHYLQEAFGYECVDAGKVNGTLGPDPQAYFVRAFCVTTFGRIGSLMSAI